MAVSPPRRRAAAATIAAALATSQAAGTLSLSTRRSPPTGWWGRPHPPTTSAQPPPGPPAAGGRGAAVGLIGGLPLSIEPICRCHTEREDREGPLKRRDCRKCTTVAWSCRKCAPQGRALVSDEAPGAHKNRPRAVTRVACHAPSTTSRKGKPINAVTRVAELEFSPRSCRGSRSWSP